MCNEANCSHDNLNDDLSDLFGDAPARTEDGEVDTTLSMNMEVKMHEEKCKACRNGTFYSWSGRPLGPCRKCNGKGVRYFRQSLEQREKAQQRYQQKKLDRAEEARQQAAEWAEQHAEEHTWLVSNAGYSDFARSLLQAVTKFGALTERQLAAVQKILKQNADRKAAAEQRAANAPTVNIAPIQEAFNRALEAGLKRPKMFLETFKFSLAPASGNNAGHIYVVEHETDTYLGKITPDARFIAVRTCTEEQEKQIIEVCANPLENAIAYGKRTGICSCCGRELTNEESIAKGIGPICEGRYF